MAEQDKPAESARLEPIRLPFTLAEIDTACNDGHSPRCLHRFFGVNSLDLELKEYTDVV